jgi:excinuclease ABC subunit C
MEEVIYRRYYRILKEKGKKPSLILVDGGLTQLHAVQNTLATMRLAIPVAGLRKNDKHTTAELLNQQGEPVDLRSHKALFFLLTGMQDEVHRFVISHHKRRRAKAQVHSVLDDVPGLGPTRKKALLLRYTSVQAIKEAPLDDLKTLVPPAVAEALFHALHPQDVV